MKNIVISTFIILLAPLLPIKTAYGDIWTSCNHSSPNHTASYWAMACTLWIIDEPDIGGLTDVKVENHQYGMWFDDGQYQGTLGPAISSLEGAITRSGFPVLMDSPMLKPITYATKYFVVEPITWSPLCADGKFYGKTAGVWSEDTTITNDAYCNTFSTE